MCAINIECKVELYELKYVYYYYYYLEHCQFLMELKSEILEQPTSLQTIAGLNRVR